DTLINSEFAKDLVCATGRSHYSVFKAARIEIDCDNFQRKKSGFFRYKKCHDFPTINYLLSLLKILGDFKVSESTFLIIIYLKTTSESAFLIVKHLIAFYAMFL
ncbi:hypothetical protein ACJX0J_011620, partial [Zea mays]